MKWIFLAIIVVVWPVAMWTMLRMVIAGWHAGQRGFGILSPSVILAASYNRENRKTFAWCIGVMVVAVIVFNLLVLAGYAKP